MALKHFVTRRSPRIDEMTVGLGDAWSANNISVTVKEGFTDAECAEQHRLARCYLAIELRKLADTIEASGMATYDVVVVIESLGYRSEPTRIQAPTRGKAQTLAMSRSVPLTPPLPRLRGELVTYETTEIRP